MPEYLSRIPNQPLQWLTPSEIAKKQCQNCDTDDFCSLYQPGDKVFAQFIMSLCDATNLACESDFGASVFEPLNNDPTFTNPALPQYTTTGGWFGDGFLAECAFDITTTGDLIFNVATMSPGRQYLIIFDETFVVTNGGTTVSSAIIVGGTTVRTAAAPAPSTITTTNIQVVAAAGGVNQNIVYRAATTGPATLNNVYRLDNVFMYELSECYQWSNQWKPSLEGAVYTAAAPSGLTYLPNVLSNRTYLVKVWNTINTGSLELHFGGNIELIDSSHETDPIEFTFNTTGTSAFFEPFDSSSSGVILRWEFYLFTEPEITLLDGAGDPVAPVTSFTKKDGRLLIGLDLETMLADSYGCYSLKIFTACESGENHDIVNDPGITNVGIGVEADWTLTGNATPADLNPGFQFTMGAVGETGIATGSAGEAITIGVPYIVRITANGNTTSGTNTLRFGGLNTVVTINAGVNTFNITPIANDPEIKLTFVCNSTLGEAVEITEIMAWEDTEENPENYSYSNCIMYGASFSCSSWIKAYPSNMDNEQAGFIFDADYFLLAQRLRIKIANGSYQDDAGEYMDSSGTHMRYYGGRQKVQQLLINPVPESMHDCLAAQKMLEVFMIDDVEYVVKEGDYSPEWDKLGRFPIALGRMDIYKKTEGLFFRKQS